MYFIFLVLCYICVCMYVELVVYYFSITGIYLPAVR